MDEGLYSPQTWSGRLVVDGIVVSSHALGSPTMEKIYAAYPQMPWEFVLSVGATPLNYAHAAWHALDAACPAWLPLCDLDADGKTSVSLAWYVAVVGRLAEPVLFLATMAQWLQQAAQSWLACAAWPALATASLMLSPRANWHARQSYVD